MELNNRLATANSCYRIELDDGKYYLTDICGKVLSLIMFAYEDEDGQLEEYVEQLIADEQSCLY